MNNYRISLRAQRNMDDIWLYIAADNIAAADELRRDFYGAYRHLAKNPHSGRVRPDISKRGYRFWNVRGNYMVAYSLDDRGDIFIRAIIHSSRNLKSLL